VWPVVSDMPIYDGFLDVYMFCMLHVSYIIYLSSTNSSYLPCSCQLQIWHGRMASGYHGLTKVSLGPAMPYACTPCRQPLLKLHVAVFLPPWIPIAVSLIIVTQTLPGVTQTLEGVTEILP
jgi:hypothetical protein